MQTAVNYIGQNSGAHQYDRIKKIYRTCLLLVAITGITVGGLMFLFKDPLLGIYLPNDPDAIKYGIMRLTIVGLPYFLCGLMEVTTGALRGLGSSVTPMIVSILGVCGVRVAWVFTIFRIPQYHSLNSLYASYPISWCASFLIELVAFIYVYKRHIRSYKSHSV